MVILWDNYIDDADLTSTSISVSKPLENLKDWALSQYYEIDSNNGVITIDLLDSKYITDFILSGTNITDEYASLTLQGNNSNTWTSPSYETAMELYKNSAVGVKDIKQTYRYWRVILQDNNLDSIILGHAYIGNRLQLPGIDPSITLSYNVGTVRSLSKSRRLYSDTNEDFFSSGFTFPHITEQERVIDGKSIANREDILEFWGVNRGATPFILIIWDNNRDRVPPLVGYIPNDALSLELDSEQYLYSLEFEFEETK